MQRQVIHVTCFDQPMSTQVRRVGGVNFGLYCKCGEFVALSVGEPGQRPIEVEFKAEQPFLVLCPYCHLEMRRQVHEILRVHLTEQNRRRPDQHIRRAGQ